MAMMCEECKCSTYLNEETGMYSCESGCPCCNDPDYVSDEEMLYKIREYVSLHLISLNQDSERVQKELDQIEDLNGDEYENATIEDVSLTGQIIATSHILKYIDEVIGNV